MSLPSRQIDLDDPSPEKLRKLGSLQSRRDHLIQIGWRNTAAGCTNNLGTSGFLSLLVAESTGLTQYLDLPDHKEVCKLPV